MQKLRIGYITAALWAVAGMPLGAEEAGSTVRLKGRTVATESSDARPCVLLKNDNVLFGQAEQVGEFVIVRAREGSEVQLARKDVACWAGSIRHLYQYRVDHRRDGDIEAHLRDARWCLQYGLNDLAATEVQAIKKHDPDNILAIAIERRLERMTERPAPAEQTSESTASVIQTAGFTDSEDDSESVDLPTLRRFASQVQPMLLNRCGRCHGQNSARAWRMHVPLGGVRASARMTRQNLISLLNYIDRSILGESDFLAMATTAHGGGAAPLDARSIKAVQALQQWLASAQRGRPADDGQTADDGQATDQSDPSVASPADPQFAQHGRVTITDPAPAVADDDQPVRLPTVANPFDPDLFNRRLTLDSDSE